MSDQKRMPEFYAEAVAKYVNTELPHVADLLDPVLWKLLKRQKSEIQKVEDDIKQRVKELMTKADEVDYLDTAFYGDWNVIKNDAKAQDILNRIGALNQPPPPHAKSVLCQTISQEDASGVKRDFEYQKQPFAYAVMAMDSYERRAKSLPVQEELHFSKHTHKITGARPFTWLRKFDFRLDHPSAGASKAVVFPAGALFTTKFLSDEVVAASPSHKPTSFTSADLQHLAKEILHGRTRATALNEGDYDGVAILFRGSEWTGVVPRSGEYPIEIRESRLTIDKEAPCSTLEQFENKSTDKNLGPRDQPPNFNTFFELSKVAREAQDHDDRGLSKIIQSTEVEAAKTFGVPQKGGKVRRIFWPEIINQYATASERMILVGIRGVMALTGAAVADVGNEKLGAVSGVMQSRADLFRQVEIQVDERRAEKATQLPGKDTQASNPHKPHRGPIRTSGSHNHTKVQSAPPRHSSRPKTSRNANGALIVQDDTPVKDGTGFIPMIFLRDFKGAFYQLFVRDLRYNAMQVWRPDGFELPFDSDEFAAKAKLDEELRTSGRNKDRKGVFRLYQSHVAGMGNRHSVWSWVRTSKIVETMLIYAHIPTIIYVDDVIVLISRRLRKTAEWAVDAILDRIGFFREQTKTVAHNDQAQSSTLEVLGIGVTRTQTAMAFHPMPSKVLKMSERAQSLFTKLLDAETALRTGTTIPHIEHKLDVATTVGMIAHVAQIQQVPAAGDALREITMDLAPTPDIWARTLSFPGPLRRMKAALAQAVSEAASQSPTVFHLSRRESAVIFDDASRCSQTGKVVLCSFLFTRKGNYAFSTELSQKVADLAFGQTGDMQELVEDAHIGIGEAAAYSLATHFWTSTHSEFLEGAVVKRFQDNLGAEANAHKIGGKTQLERAFMSVAGDIVTKFQILQLFGYVRSELNISDTGTAKTDEMIRLYNLVLKVLQIKDMSTKTHLVREWETSVMKRINERKQVIASGFRASLQTLGIQFTSQLQKTVINFDASTIATLKKINDMWDISVANDALLNDGTSVWEPMAIHCTPPRKTVLVRLLRFSTAYVLNSGDIQITTAPLGKNPPGKDTRRLGLPPDWRKQVVVKENPFEYGDEEVITTLPPKWESMIPWPTADRVIQDAISVDSIPWETTEVTGASEPSKGKAAAVILRQSSRKIPLVPGTPVVRHCVTGALTISTDTMHPDIPSDVQVRGVRSLALLEYAGPTHLNVSPNIQVEHLYDMVVKGSGALFTVISSAEVAAHLFRGIAVRSLETRPQVYDITPGKAASPAASTLLWSWQEAGTPSPQTFSIVALFDLQKRIIPGQSFLLSSDTVRDWRDSVVHADPEGSNTKLVLALGTSPTAVDGATRLFEMFLKKMPKVTCHNVVYTEELNQKRKADLLQRAQVTREPASTEVMVLSAADVRTVVCGEAAQKQPWREPAPFFSHAADAGNDVFQSLHFLEQQAIIATSSTAVLTDPDQAALLKEKKIDQVMTFTNRDAGLVFRDGKWFLTALRVEWCNALGIPHQQVRIDHAPLSKKAKKEQ